jgi:adenylate kinase family enzyme
MAAASKEIGRRIAVVGTTGCGKTYVAEALADILGISYVCNDAIEWRPDWQPTPAEVRVAEMEAATGGDAWTSDGNISSSAGQDQIVLERCDTIVWLDLPRWQVWSQVTWRSLGRIRSREPLWHGNVESWSRLRRATRSFSGRFAPSTGAGENTGQCSPTQR